MEYLGERFADRVFSKVYSLYWGGGGGGDWGGGECEGRWRGGGVVVNWLTQYESM